jgi:hypothetical protein
MSGNIVILVPTRKRARSIVPLARAFANTVTGLMGSVWLMLCVDGNDNHEYKDVYNEAVEIYPHMMIGTGPRRGLVGTLNYYSARMIRPEIRAIGYMGDDHRPMTQGWDEQVHAALDAMQGMGIVYGDDGIQHETLPTACVISTPILIQLGHMAPPVLQHMYCDNYWRDLGLGANCLMYLPDMKITHLHPSVGAADWDESYLESNHPDIFAADKLAYEKYKQDFSLASDIAKISIQGR